ncbi:MAG: CBO0543 family protein [Heyndrickxia coagulans]
MLCTTLFAMCLELIVNLFLDIKYDLFGYFTKGVDRKSLYYLFGIYPAINILFINFFPNRFRARFLYIAGWTIIALVFEFLFRVTGTFYYNGWKPVYSAIAYPILFCILALFYKIVHLICFCSKIPSTARHPNKWLKKLRH